MVFTIGYRCKEMFMMYITVHLILFTLTIANSLFINCTFALDFYPLRGDSGELILGLGSPGSALLSPQGDRIITNSLFGYLLWDVTKNPPEPSLLLDKNSGYSPIQFLADGKQLAIRKGESFKIIEVDSKKTLYENDSPDLRYARVFSPDEKKVLSFFYNRVEVYDLESRKIVKTLSDPSLTDPTNGPISGQMSTNNRWVGAEFSDNAQPIVWNYETGEVVRLFSRDYSDITFSKDEKWMATENAKTGQIQVFDVETGEAVYAFSDFMDYATGQRLLLQYFNEMKFSRFQQNILIVSKLGSGEIFFIDVATGIARRLDTPVLGFPFIYFKTDAYDKRLLTQNEDNLVHLWDVETGEEIERIDAFPERFLKGVFSPDGKSVITGHWDTLFRTMQTVVDPEQYVYMHQWDAETGQPLRSIIGHTDGVRKIVFTAEGKNALSASGREFIFWDASAWTPIWSIPIYFNIPTEDLESKYYWPGLPACMSIALSSDEKTFVSIYRMDAILRDMDTREILQDFVGHPKTIRDVAISPDGSLVATGAGEGDPDTGQTWDTTARIFNRQTGTELVRIQHGFPVVSVQFSPDGQQLLTGSWDGTAALWNVKTGGLIRQFKHDDTWVEKAVYTPDKKHILTVSNLTWHGSNKNEIRIWDLEGNIVYSLKPYDTNSWNNFIDADLSPDQQRLLTISNNYAQIWDIPGVLPTLAVIRDCAIHE
ncbi:MAG: WD40 repeat domain-containing protein [Candidatus Omnitrophota bacterium]